MANNPLALDTRPGSIHKRPLSAAESNSLADSPTGSERSLAGLAGGPKPLIFRLTDRLRLDRHLVACVMCEFFCSWFFMVSQWVLGFFRSFYTCRTFVFM